MNGRLFRGLLNVMAALLTSTLQSRSTKSFSASGSQVIAKAGGSMSHIVNRCSGVSGLSRLQWGKRWKVLPLKDERSVRQLEQVQ